MVMISFDVKETWTINDIERSRKYIYKLKNSTPHIHLRTSEHTLKTSENFYRISVINLGHPEKNVRTGGCYT